MRLNLLIVGPLLKEEATNPICLASIQVAMKDHHVVSEAVHGTRDNKHFILLSVDQILEKGSYNSTQLHRENLRPIRRNPTIENHFIFT